MSNRRIRSLLLSAAVALGASFSQEAFARRVVFDSSGRVVRIEDGADTTSYSYDGAGTLVGVQRRAAGGLRRRAALLSDVSTGDARIVGEVTEIGNAQLYAMGPAGVVAQTARAAQSPAVEPYYTLTDHLGSVRAILNPAANVVGRKAYEPFGGVRHASGVSSRYGFAGEWESPDATIWLRTRTYDPAASRFLQRDGDHGSLDDAQTWNRYAYAKGNPVRWQDPEGTSPRESLEFFGDYMRGAGGAAANIAINTPSALLNLAPSGFEAYYRVGAHLNNHFDPDQWIDPESSPIKPVVPYFEWGAPADSAPLAAHLGYGVTHAVFAVEGARSLLASLRRGTPGAGAGDALGGVAYRELGGGAGGVAPRRYWPAGFVSGQTPQAPYTTISGHGTITPGATMRVPENMRIWVLAPPGGIITDELGRIADAGSSLRGIRTKVYESGARMPNVLVHPPAGLTLAGSPITVKFPTPLSWVLYHNKLTTGDVCVATCQAITGGKRSPFSGLRYGSKGIVRPKS